MDMVYLVVIAAFFVTLMGLALGCSRLEAQS